MNLDTAAKALKELGHPTRLNVFKLLVKSGHNGLPVGRLQESLAIPNSTLSHHISRLVSVKLVEQHREGRVLTCVPQYGVLDQLILFLGEECCFAEENKSCGL